MQNDEKIQKLIDKSNQILVRLTSHRLPFDFFPDTLNIEESRLTVVSRQFFFTSEVHSVDIKDITNVLIDFSPFFAHLTVISRNFSENEIKVKYLRRSEAIYARRIIEGLRVFQEKKVDTSDYSADEIMLQLEGLSTTKIEK